MVSVVACRIPRDLLPGDPTAWISIAFGEERNLTHAAMHRAPDGRWLVPSGNWLLSADLAEAVEAAIRRAQTEPDDHFRVETEHEAAERRAAWNQKRNIERRARMAATRWPG